SITTITSCNCRQTDCCGSLFKGACLLAEASLRASPAQGYVVLRPVFHDQLQSTGFYSPSTAGERPWVLGRSVTLEIVRATWLGWACGNTTTRPTCLLATGVKAAPIFEQKPGRVGFEDNVLIVDFLVTLIAADHS
ncbi:hypothetical protein M406DRAFT_358113, partial [Cryphonectria parasitica EP155]